MFSQLIVSAQFRFTYVTCFCINVAVTNLSTQGNKEFICMCNLNQNQMCC